MNYWPLLVLSCTISTGAAFDNASPGIVQAEGAGRASATIGGERVTPAAFAVSRRTTMSSSMLVASELRAFHTIAATSAPTAAVPQSVELAAVRDLIAAGKYLEGEEAALQAVAQIEAARGAAAIEVAEAIDLVLQARRLGRRLPTSGTVALAERALAIKEAALGADDVSVANTLVLLGLGYSANREHARAKQAIERAIAIRERAAAAGADEIPLAAALNALASARRSAAQPAEAAAAAERALAVARRVEQPPGNETASALSALSIASRMRGDLEGAVRLSEEVLAIDERLRGPDHPSLAGSLVVLSGALWDLGDTERSRALHERAIRLLEASPGNERRLAFEYVSLASKLENMGDYANGFALAERGAAAAERTSGAGSTLTAAALDQLAQMQTHLGDRPAARATRERAAAIWRDAQGPDSVHVATALNGIAESFEEAGELDAAFEVVARALRIQALAQQPAVYSRVLQTHGRLLAARGQRAEARVSFEKAREVSAAAPFATARTDLAMTLTLLARLDRDEGQPARALPRYREAIALFEQELGPTHIRTAEHRTEYAAALAEAGDIEQARIELAAGERASVEHLRLVARTLSDRRALEFAADRRSGVDLAVTLATRAPGRTDTETRDDWQMVIRARTVVLDEMAARQRTVVSEADQAGVRERWAAVTHARARLANLIVRGGEGMEPEQYQALVARTSTERDAAERDLARASLSFRQEQQRVRASAPEVLARLPAGAALVSFVRYTPQRLAGDAPPDAGGTTPAARAADRTAYAAFIARAGAALQVVALGPAHDLDEAIAAWRAGIQAELNAGGLGGRRTEADYRAAGAALRTRLWDPIRPHLGAATSVFIVPDGAIHLVDFSTLPIGTAGYLVQEPITLHYLLAERDLMQAAPPPSGRRLLALGAADFDSLTPDAAEPSGTAAAMTTSSSPSPSPSPSPSTSTSTSKANANVSARSNSNSHSSSNATSNASSSSNPPLTSAPATTAGAAGTIAARAASADASTSTSAATPSARTTTSQTASQNASTAPRAASEGASPGTSASTDRSSPNAVVTSRNATPAAPSSASSSAPPPATSPASSHAATAPTTATAATATGARDAFASSIDTALFADATASGVAAALAGPATRQAGAGCDSFARRTFAPLPGTEIEMQQIAGIWQHRASGGRSAGTGASTSRGGNSERADAAAIGDRDLVLLEGGGATEAAFKTLAHDRRVLHLATHGFFLDRFCAPDTGTTAAVDAATVAVTSGTPATGATAAGTAAPGTAATSGSIAPVAPASTTTPAFAPTPENAPARPESPVTRSSPAPVSGTSPAAAATDPGANVASAGATVRTDVPRQPAAATTAATAAIARPIAIAPLEASPLLRSGLVLAGANQRARRGRDEEDGILTAEEIAGLDLSATQWAVLSACDTGRGDWQAGEGVVGLRRAFLVAGARTVILSLWPVIDTVAADWMTELYRGKFVRDVTTGSAARAASRTLLARRRAAGASTHPLYWAGFLATGDWR